jgi:hypothetical protein
MYPQQPGLSRAPDAEVLRCCSRLSLPPRRWLCSARTHLTKPSEITTAHSAGYTRPTSRCARTSKRNRWACRSRTVARAVAERFSVERTGVTRWRLSTACLAQNGRSLVVFCLMTEGVQDHWNRGDG